MQALCAEASALDSRSTRSRPRCNRMRISCISLCSREWRLLPRTSPGSHTNCDDFRAPGLALKSLDVSGNQIGGVGAVSAADYLSENPFLEVLNISRNKIVGRDDISPLLSSLAKNRCTALTWLSSFLGANAQLVT